MNINKERKKQNRDDIFDNDNYNQLNNKPNQMNLNQIQIQDIKGQSSKMYNQKPIMATGLTIKKLEEVKNNVKEPQKNVFVRLTEVVKKRDQSSGMSPDNNKSNEYGGVTLKSWLDKKNANKSGS